MRLDYPTLEAIHAQARRERSEAVYRMLIAPVVRLFRRRAARAPSVALHGRLA
jgi:hypothetical protein